MPLKIRTFLKYRLTNFPLNLAILAGYFPTLISTVNSFVIALLNPLLISLLIPLLIPLLVPEPIWASSPKENFFHGQPFWQKPPLYKKIVEERWLAVSSKWEGDPKSWLFLGGGQVHLPVKQTWEKVRQYHRLAEVKEFFKSVEYDSSEKKLALKIKMLAFEKNLVVKFQELEKPGQSLFDYEIRFSIISGFMQGLEGRLGLKGIDSGPRSDTDLDFRAWSHSEVSWPNWFFALTTESLMYHVAVKLRQLLEQQE